MSASPNSGASRAKKEAILFALLLACGLVLLPIAIYLVGSAVFGDYSEGGLGAFFKAVMSRVFQADPGALFLVLSPYLTWQSLRLAVAALRWRSPASQPSPDP